MKDIFYRIVCGYILGIFLFAAVSCDDESDSGLPRLFKPTKLATTVEYNGFIVTWEATAGAEGYEVEISLSQEFETVAAEVRTDARTLTATFTGLEENQLYHIRLRGIKEEAALNSKYIYGEVTTGAAYSIFFPVAADRLSFTAALLTWRDEVEADRLVVERTTPGEAQEIELPVTAENNQQRQIRVSGLTDGISYKATLYQGEISFGYTVFTVLARPEGMITLTAETKDHLQAALDEATEGTTIMFTGGEIFDYSQQDIRINKGVILMGEPGTEKPKLYVKNLLIGGKKAASSVTLGEVKLQRIDFSGFQLVEGREQQTAEPNLCLVSFDFSQTPEVSLEKLSVENCIIRDYANSFLELNDNLKAGSGRKARIGEILVDRVMAFDLGRNKSGYPSFISISNKNDRNGYCKKYIIRNSTFHHLLRGLIEARVFTTIDGYTDPEITVENCTFDHWGLWDASSDLWYGTNNDAIKNAFDFKASGVTTQIQVTLSNCIFGEIATARLSDKFFQGVTAVVENCYMISATKRVISGGTDDMLPVEASADELFPQRGNQDYTVGLTGEVQEAGDPYWNK